jgi:hypothetical protein
VLPERAGVPQFCGDPLLALSEKCLVMMAVVEFLTTESAGGGFLVAGNSPIFFSSRHQSACSLVVAFTAFLMPFLRNVMFTFHPWPLVILCFGTI